MKRGSYYNNEHYIPKSNFGKELTLVKKDKNCTCEPVSNDKLVCYATLDRKVYILDIETLNIIKELNLNTINQIRKIKRKTYIQLFLIENILIIEIGDQYFKFNIELDNLDLLMTNKGLIVISDSVLFNDNLYFEARNEKKYAIETLNHNLCKNEVEIILKDVSKFLVGTGQKVFIGLENSVLCYDLITRNEIWNTPISHFGNYYDEIWEKEKKGSISIFAVVINNQLIVGVDQGKVVSLNIHTGTINWVLTLNDESASPRIVYIEESDFFYICANNLFEINLRTGTINKTYNIDEKLRILKLSSGKLFASNRYFYISSAKRNPSLILLDKIDGAILDVYELEDYCYNLPTVHGKYLTLLDSSDNLYFYKSNLD